MSLPTRVSLPVCLCIGHYGCACVGIHQKWHPYNVYCRALIHSGANELDKAEAVLRRVVLPDGQLLLFEETTDVKLAMLFTEVTAPPLSWCIQLFQFPI